MGIIWSKSEEPLSLQTVGPGSAAEKAGLQPGMILTKLNDETVKEMHEAGLDNAGIIAKMKTTARPLTLTLEMAAKGSDSTSDEATVDPSIPVGKATGSAVLAEIKAENTYGHNSETSDLLKSLFMTEWNASRGAESRDARLLGLEAEVTTTTLRSWLKQWQDELAEEKMVALMKEGTPADIPKPKPKRRWWQREKEPEPPKRMIPFAPKPLPMGPDELAFVRLKVRSRQILADLHEGFFGGDHDGHPKPVPGSLMSFLGTIVGNDCIFSTTSTHWWGNGWVLPSESKLIEVNPRGATRNANKPKAILIVLNFVVAKTLIHRLVQEPRPRGSSKDLQA